MQIHRNPPGLFEPDTIPEDRNELQGSRGREMLFIAETLISDCKPEEAW